MMPENPLGPKHCICQWGEGNFVCTKLMDAEDGLCTGCREGSLCTEERELLQEMERT